MTAFIASVGTGPAWRQALHGCLEALPASIGQDRVGLVYVSEGLGEVLDLVVDELCRRTSIRSWFGASARGVFGTGAPSATTDGRVGILLSPWAPDRVSFFADGPGKPAGERSPAGQTRIGILHADERLRRSEGERIGPADAFSIGGLSPSRATLRIAGGPVESEVTGLILDPSVEVVTGLAQGCAPIGPQHRVSAARGAWLLGLDDRPAFSVLSEEMGELLARRPDRVGRYIHVALPGRADVAVTEDRVRPILAIEPRDGAIAVATPLRTGQELRFVKPDVAAARSAFERLLRDLQRRLAGRPPRAALLILSDARGRRGNPDLEIDLVRSAFGQVPLIGVRTDDEIFAGQLHSLTAVLALIP
jgi:hypothetical protein